MCIIAYKPQNIAFPSKETLKTCFQNNPDGAGYMYVYDKKVEIRKGFTTFETFYNALSKSRKITGDDVPYVMHFRISTQAHGRKDCTHPFPLSKKMDNLRKLNVSCKIGIAHNGIISLTSSSWHSKTITYSDTMKYITDILSLIIKNKGYYKDKDTLLLIERTCESKLAILDNDGHCELIGDFEENDGIYYSNHTYQTKKYSTFKFGNYDDDYEKWWEKFDNDGNKKDTDYNDYYDTDWEAFWNKDTEQYDFDPIDCPMSYADYSDCYCDFCSNRKNCYYYQDEDEENDNE